MSKPNSFIIFWDDDQGVCAPMQWDPDCEGAVCALHKGEIALFDTKPAARRAIDISTKFALLQKAQGKPANDDFLGAAKACLRIVPCRKGGGA